jgi:hypothetical protein
VCISIIVLSLKRLIPAQLKLPTDIPSYFQRTCLSSLAFLNLAEPFVRFFCVPVYFPRLVD